jgi:hypothetical protein
LLRCDFSSIWQIQVPAASCANATIDVVSIGTPDAPLAQARFDYNFSFSNLRSIEYRTVWLNFDVDPVVGNIVDGALSVGGLSSIRWADTVTTGSATVLGVQGTLTAQPPDTLDDGPTA